MEFCQSLRFISASMCSMSIGSVESLTVTRKKFRRIQSLFIGEVEGFPRFFADSKQRCGGLHFCFRPTAGCGFVFFTHLCVFVCVFAWPDSWLWLCHSSVCVSVCVCVCVCVCVFALA